MHYTGGKSRPPGCMFIFMKQVRTQSINKSRRHSPAFRFIVLSKSNSLCSGGIIPVVNTSTVVVVVVVVVDALVIVVILILTVIIVIWRIGWLAAKPFLILYLYCIDTVL